MRSVKRMLAAEGTVLIVAREGREEQAGHCPTPRILTCKPSVGSTVNLWWSLPAFESTQANLEGDVD